MAELSIEETEQEEYEALPLDRTYLCEIQSYDIVDSSFRDKDGNPRKDIKWTLRVVEPKDFYDRVLVFWTPFRASRHRKTGAPNKTLLFLNYLGLQLDFPKQDKVNLDVSLGKKINISLKNKFGVGGRIFQKVDSFFPTSQEGTE